MSLCKYRDIFGAPGTGVHSIRFAGVAIVDVVLTVASGWLISLYVKSMPFWQITALLFLTGILLHHLFCVRTTIDKLLFPA